jgi:hypothetical protein
MAARAEENCLSSSFFLGCVIFVPNEKKEIQSTACTENTGIMIPLPTQTYRKAC